MRKQITELIEKRIDGLTHTHTLLVELHKASKDVFGWHKYLAEIEDVRIRCLEAQHLLEAIEEL